MSEPYPSLPEAGICAPLTGVEAGFVETPGRLRRLGRAARQAGAAAVAVAGNMMGGMDFTPNDVETHLAASTYAAPFQHARGVGREWRQRNEGVIRKYIDRPIKASAATANLALGDAMAVGAQGIAQRHMEGLPHATLTSMLTGLGATALVEIGFGYVSARGNPDVTPSRAAKVRAAIAGFWCGGSMGIEREKLSPKHMAGPIGAYMMFGTGVTLLGEVSNLAARLLEEPLFYASIGYAAAGMKLNDIFGADGLLEHMASQSLRVYDKVRPGRVEPAN